MDLSGLKGRIAEAVVESMFRRAGYRVGRVGREADIPALMQAGRSQYQPDSLLWRPEPRDPPDPHLHRLVAIEVKYRSSLSEFIRHDLPDIVRDIRDQWPDLYWVLVTDRPAAGRSCFQALSMRDEPRETSLRDLHEVSAFNIYPSTVREYDHLVTAIFRFLSMYDRGDDRLEAGPAQPEA
jgi:hypothetical protein